MLQPETVLKPAQTSESQLSAVFDDPDFLAIHQRMSPFNVFEAVGANRGELRHSNFLAYLLSPTRPHGLGASVLAAILRRVLLRLVPEARPIMMLELIASDLDAAVAQAQLFTGLVKPMGVQWVTIFSRDLLTARHAKGLSFKAQATNVGLAWSDFQGRTLQSLIDAVLDVDARLAAMG